VRLLTHGGGWDAEIVAATSSEGDSISGVDWQVPLLSLPLALGVFEPMPMTRAYFRADDGLRREWRERLGARSAMRVGLVWAGSSAHKEDRFRSVQPDEFRPLLHIPGIQFYSLQLARPREEAKRLIEAGLRDFTEHITDFADTAAFLAELDLIVSVDTAVAHLAGAMGRPVWLLAPFQADWRWGPSGESTRWYPSVRLFRQPAIGDWGTVVRSIAKRLATLASESA
jgi:hypothetical protein